MSTVKILRHYGIQHKAVISFAAVPQHVLQFRRHLNNYEINFDYFNNKFWGEITQYLMTVEVRNIAH